ncbi:MAG: diguanylate cyclase [Thermoguttaceae bacterium]|nr:diguanylate cyclase [Thermoguttaceae bacterium]MDW8038900.1 diguanylate cyclase [Thermoguttaceae bacterium]
MVFWVIMAVAIGNLFLGFGLAVFLHRRYQTWLLSEIAGATESPPGVSGESNVERFSETVNKKKASALGSGVNQNQPVLTTPALGPREIASYDATPIWEGSPEEGVMASLPEGREPAPTHLEGPSQSAEEPTNAGLAEGKIAAESPVKLDEKTAAFDPEASLRSVPAENLSELHSLKLSEEDLFPPKPRKNEPAERSGLLSESPASLATESSSSSEANGLDSILSVSEQSRALISQEVPGLTPMKDKLPEKTTFLEAQLSVAQEATRSQSMGLEDLCPPSSVSARSHQEALFFQQSLKQQKISEPERVLPEPPVAFQTNEEPNRQQLLASEALPSAEVLPSEPPSVSAPGEVFDGSDSSLSAGLPSLRQDGLEASLERALTQWQMEAARYFEELSRTRNKVQNFSPSPQLEELHASWTEIHQAGQQYLATARPVRETFGQFSDLPSRMRPIRDHLNTLAAKEETLIELSQELIPTQLPQMDTHLLRQQLLQHTDRLLEANRKVQSALEIARRGPTEPTALPDHMSRSRAATSKLLVESVRQKVNSWWDQRRVHIPRLSLIILEIDDFEQLEEDYGTLLCEGLLQALEKILEGFDQQDDFLVRLRGPGFARFCAHRSLEQAAELAERLRQTLMNTRFYRKNTELRISVSCGLTEATREDTPETLFERAEAALLQARRYGKGRTFLHDGYFPMPVPSHPLPIWPKQMEI